MPQGTMPPPGEKPALAIAIGMKPKGEPPEDQAPEQPDGNKHSREEAHPIEADERCSNCKNYQGESGECEKVEGYWEPDAACVKFFEAAGGEGEPDTDDASGVPDEGAE